MADQGLLFETLSWLDSLPSALPSSLVQYDRPELPMYPTARALTTPSPRRVNFSSDLLHDRATYSAMYSANEDYEDRQESWSDRLIQKRSYLQYGLRRWRRYLLSHSRAISGMKAESGLSDTPAWRAFLLVVRGLRRWRQYTQQMALQRQRMDKIASCPLKMVKKMRNSLLYWRLVVCTRRRARARVFARWVLRCRQLTVLRQLLLRRSMRQAICTWRRRARWPRVAAHWQSYHLHLALCALRSHRLSAFTSSLQTCALALADQHLLRATLRKWISRLVSRLGHALQRKVRGHLRARGWFGWSLWRQRLGLLTQHRQQAQLARRYHLQYSLQVAWQRMQGSLQILQRTRRNHTLGSQQHLRKMFHCWLHNSHTYKKKVIRDGMCIYLKRQLHAFRKALSRRTKDRISRHAYQRATQRLFLQIWKQRAQTLHKHSLHLGYRRYYLRRWLVFCRQRRQAHRQNRWMLRRWGLRRWLARCLFVRHANQRYYRGQLRYLLHTTARVLHHWQCSAVRSASLRRRYTVFTTICSQKYHPLIRIQQGDSTAPFENVHYKNRRLLEAVWERWVHGYLPRQRRIKAFTSKQRTKKRISLLAVAWTAWSEYWEEKHVTKRSMRSALIRWRSRLQTVKKAQRMLLQAYKTKKHQLRNPSHLRYILVADRSCYEIYRCFQRWHGELVNHHLQAREVSYHQAQVLKQIKALHAHEYAVASKHRAVMEKQCWIQWQSAVRSKATALRRINTRLSLRKPFIRWVQAYNRLAVMNSLQVPGNQSISAIEQTSANHSNQSMMSTSRAGRLIGDLTYIAGYKENHPPSSAYNTPIASYKIHPTSYANPCQTPTTQSIHVSSRQGTPRSVDKQELRRGYYSAYQRRMMALHQMASPAVVGK